MKCKNKLSHLKEFNFFKLENNSFETENDSTITDEIYELLSNNISFKISKDEMQNILDIAENLGYYDGEYSNNPSELIAFIDGYLSCFKGNE